MSVDVDNEGVGGVEGDDRSVSKYIPSVASQLVKDVDEPNTEEDIKTIVETKIGDEKGGGGGLLIR